MASRIIELRDAVRHELAAGDAAGAFSREFTPEAVLYARLRTEELTELRVLVAARGDEPEQVSRTRIRHNYRIQVGLIAPAGDDGEAEQLVALAEQIADYLTRRELSATPDARWLATEWQTPYVAETLDRNAQFATVITVAYRVAGSADG